MISKDFAVGIVLMYNGTGVGVGNGSGSTDPEKRYNRTNEISIANGDSFDLKGWYICNGKVTNVPDLTGSYSGGKYIRGANDNGSNQSGGSDDAVLVQHNHGGTSGYNSTHNHGGTTLGSGNHTHTITDIVRILSSDYGWVLFGNFDNNPKTGFACDSSRESYGDHSHTLLEGSSAHTHTTTSTGTDSRTNRNMPEYHSVIPIIRKN